MLRITETVNGKTPRMRLEGRVVGPYVKEVRRSCEKFLGVGRILTLDMGEVSFVDRDGLNLLRELIDRQVRLVNCSPFLSEQLKEDAS